MPRGKAEISQDERVTPRTSNRAFVVAAVEGGRSRRPNDGGDDDETDAATLGLLHVESHESFVSSRWEAGTMENHFFRPSPETEVMSTCRRDAFVSTTSSYTTLKNEVVL